MRTVGQNLASIRERLGLSQVDLADRLKMRQPSLWKLENAKGIPKGTTLLKLAKALPATVESLLQGVDAQYDKSRDLLGQGQAVQGGSQQKGEPDEPASDRARQLEARLKEYERLIHELETITHRLAFLAAQRAEDAAAPRAAPGISRSHRKAAR